MREAPRSTEIDRSAPPPASAARSCRFPGFVHSRLTNGLELYLARWPHYPLVNLHLLLPAGAQYVRPETAGLASLHGSLLDEGTETRSALEIAASIEDLGGFLGTGADWDIAYLSFTLLVTHLDAGLELVTEMARRPSFPEEEVERMRRHRLAEILRSKGRPASLADRYFARLIYPGTPYGVPLLGTEESVKALGREHFAEFNRLHVGPAGASLIAVGDFDPEALARRLEEHFGDWPQQPSVVRPTIEPKSYEGLVIHLVDRPGSPQTQLQLGHPGLPRQHPDYAPAMALNAILGGKFTSRLNLNLREERGITYSVYSHFVHRQATGPFVIRAAVATDSAGTAVREILHEIERLRAEKISEEELRETQDFLIGVFPITLQTVGDLAKRLETLAIFDLPDDYYVRYPAAMFSALTCEDIREAARRHLHPDRMAIVAVGPADDLRGQLEELGPVTVVEP